MTPNSDHNINNNNNNNNNMINIQAAREREREIGHDNDMKLFHSLEYTLYIL